ncbi:hypothetical protein RAA17_11385 [Komagataeibacter rhaeticus]|nr:hypothetical protein [Komagataeibacter rhaeticus]
MAATITTALETCAAARARHAAAQAQVTQLVRQTTSPCRSHAGYPARSRRPRMQPGPERAPQP